MSSSLPVMIIELDATAWTTVHQFYQALFSAIKAPDWHGRNINALVDSMIWGGINELEPPYHIRISGADRLPEEVRHHIEYAQRSLSRACEEYHARKGKNIDVKIQIAH